MKQTTKSAAKRTRKRAKAAGVTYASKKPTLDKAKAAKGSGKPAAKAKDLYIRKKATRKAGEDQRINRYANSQRD